MDCVKQRILFTDTHYFDPLDYFLNKKNGIQMGVSMGEENKNSARE